MITTQDIFNSALLPFGGANSNSFGDKNTIISSAVKEVRKNVDILEAKKVVPLTPAVYSGDNLYVFPTDADILIGLTPPGGQSSDRNTDFLHTSGDRISDEYRYLNANELFTTEYRMGTRLLRINGGNQQTAIELNGCESLTADGTVTVSGDGANLGVNEVFYLNGSKSIDFDIVQSIGTTSLIFTGISKRDISAITRDGGFSLGLYVPSALVGGLSNVRLRIGTDASNYYQANATVNSYGSAFTEGFNSISFNRRSASTVGTVTETNITYLEITLTHTVSAVGVKVDHIIARKGFGLNLSYYSLYYFINASGTSIATPVSATLADNTIFNNDTFNLIVLEAQRIMDRKLKGDSSGVIYKSATDDLFGVQNAVEKRGAYTIYRNHFPSERKPSVIPY